MKHFPKFQVPPLPVRAADPARLASGLGGVGGRAGEAVHHAGAGPGDGDCVQQLGGHRGEDKALGAAGRPQPELVDQHDEPLRIDVLLRLPGMMLPLLDLDKIVLYGVFVFNVHVVVCSLQGCLELG